MYAKLYIITINVYVHYIHISTIHCIFASHSGITDVQPTVNLTYNTHHYGKR